MTKKIVDARNLSCLQPIVLTMKALEEADEVTAVVDNKATRDRCNLTKAWAPLILIAQLNKAKGWERD